VRLIFSKLGMMLILSHIPGYIPLVMSRLIVCVPYLVVLYM
jgi:hypothetical protein